MTSGRAINCRVCWLPSPNGPGEACSDRCRGLWPLKRDAVLAERARWEEDVLAAVRALAPKATECPGLLAQRLFAARGTTVDGRAALACVREIYYHLRAAGRLRFYQKGVVVPLGKDDVRGPFRIGK